jgi:hypothetical protein
MMQPPGRFCANCGTALEAGQRFCPNCGSATDAAASNATARSGLPPDAATSMSASSSTDGPPVSSPDYGRSTGPESGSSFTPPPPPPDEAISTLTPPPPPVSSYPSYMSSTPSYLGERYPSTGQPVPGSYMAVPDFVRPQPQRRPRAGWIAGALVVLVVLIGGVFLVPKLFPSSSASPGKKNTPAALTTPGQQTTGTTPPPAEPKEVTFSKPLTFTYKSVDISVIGVKQAAAFDDDDGYYPDGNPGILRLTLKEANNDPSASYSAYYPESDLLLVLPDGSTVKAKNADSNSSVDNGVTRNNWADFPVSLATDPSQIVLRVGSSSEAQIEVPLKEGADLSKYQSKTVNVNKAVTYGNLKWTIISATLSLSHSGDQAKKDQIYVYLKFKVQNTSNENPAINSPYDYLRMQSGDITSSVKDTGDIPVTFEVNSTTNCSAGFLVPVSADGKYTLVLLGTNDSYWTKNQATITFEAK